MRKRTRAFSARRAVVGILCAACIHCASGEVIYRGLQDIPIPTDFNGVYLNIDNGATSTGEFSGWDINPFFGGVGVGNSARFQPAQTGGTNESPILALGFGAPVGGNLTFSSGQGGSESHLGNGPNQFGIGQEAYLGFRFSTDANAGPFYGWMRVIFTANTSGALLKDWAYETSGLATTTGNVLQAAPVAGVSTVTLSGGAGQNATLGPLPGGFALAIFKTGGGTWNLAAPGIFSSLATSGGVTNVQTSLTNAAVTAGAGSTINFEVSQTLSELVIADGGVVGIESVNIGSAPPLPLAAPFAKIAANIPEPGSAALVASACAIMSAGSRRRVG